MRERWQRRDEAARGDVREADDERRVAVIENELGPQNDKDGAADNPEGADDFRVDMLKVRPETN